MASSVREGRWQRYGRTVQRQPIDLPEKQSKRRTIGVFGREFRMPQSRGLRIAIGVVLVVLGIFGFLPILGFWMVPLGLLVLSYEFAFVRRQRRRVVVWWERRRRPSAG